MTAILLQNISKKYGDIQVLEPTTFSFENGITTVLIGPSGCGKSTLLRLILRLITQTTGRIFFFGKELTDQNVNEIRQKIGYVTQDGGLFPHLTAEHNISLVARFLGYPSGCIKQKIKELCELMQVPPSLLGLYPKELSGGQKQRMSLMRALMLDPPCILLDEPLGSLDPITRHELQIQLKRVFGHLQKTVILVTHDMAEAAYFANEIILMRAGRIVQKGSFEQLVFHPQESFVEEFIRLQQLPFYTDTRRNNA